MENILKLVKHNIKMFFNEPWGIVLLILPIAISVMSIKVFNVDNMSLDGILSIYGTTSNQKMIEILAERVNRANIGVNLFFDTGDARIGVEEDEVSLAIMIEDENMLEGLARGQMDMEIFYKEDNINAEAMKSKLEVVMQEMQLLAKASGGNEESFEKLYQELKGKTNKISIREDNSSYLANKQAFGIFTMLLLMSGGYGLRVMAREKELRVYDRIGMAPVKKYQYILGHVGGSLILLGIQVVLEWIVLNGLGINFNLSMGVFLTIGIIMILISIAVSLFLLALSDNANVFSVLLGFVVPPMAMLSDCIFPIEFLPEWINKVSLISPLRWVMMGYNGALVGESIWQIFGYLGLAGLLAVVLILLSIIIETQKKTRVSSGIK